MNQPLVSIIMPSYNSAAFIAESIESIQQQTYTNWELLITDDSSTDNTVKIINSYAKEDPRIQVFVMESNVGAGYTRNNSLRAAKGRYIAFCDSDDRWLPEKLEKQIAFMNEKDCCLAYSSYIVCNEEGENIGVIIAPPEQTLQDTKHDDKIGFLTTIYDTEKCEKFLMPPLRKRQDWAYVLQIQQKCGKAFAIEEPLAIYRKRRVSVSSQKLSLIRYAARVYNIVFGYPLWYSYVYLYTVFIPCYFWKRLTIRSYQNKYRKLYSK